MNDKTPPPEEPENGLTIERALAILQQGAFGEEQGLMRYSSNYTFLLPVTHDDVTVLAVYKPQQGERPLWDFPEGTLCYREVAAFVTSEALGWHLVPPTVLREATRGTGSLQLFINHDPEYNYFAFDETMIPQLMRLALFDIITNNADRKGGHCIVDDGGHLWGIDHGLTFNIEHKLRTVIWDFAGQPIPEPLLEDLAQLCAQLEDANSAYRRQLSDLIHEREIDAFQRRLQKVLQERSYPKPGRGPNYPWPPV